MSDHIDDRVSALVEAEQHKRRDGTGMAVGVFLIAAGIGVAAGATAGGWWLLAILPASFLILLGAVGLATSAALHERDDRGNVITQRETPAAPT